jgi:acyl carrier protein
MPFLETMTLFTDTKSLCMWLPFNSVLIALLFGVGLGIGLAAALLTYRECRLPKDGSSDGQRQDALERFRVWHDFWKYFLVSFALVLITTLLGNTLKERELKLQKVKQKGDLALEKEKQASASLIAENTNLGSFLDKALADTWQKQYAFASYFSHVTRDSAARQRWLDYASFIEQTQERASKLEAEKTNTDVALAKLDPNSPKRSELESKREEVQSQLALTTAILQTPKLIKRIGRSDVINVGGAVVFSAGMAIDALGAPKAYHPDSRSGLDYLANAGMPGNWWVLVTDNGLPSGKPVIQNQTDPAPGYYISSTSLQDESKARTDPTRYVDSSAVPYVVLPGHLTADGSAKLGDLAAVYYRPTGKLEFAVLADIGPIMHIGEGSIALAKALGVPSDPKIGGCEDGVTYVLFPNSGAHWPMVSTEIRERGSKLFEAWIRNLVAPVSKESTAAANGGAPHTSHSGQPVTRPTALNRATESKDIDSKIKDIIIEVLGVNPEQVVATANLVDDLGANEIDVAEIVMAFAEQFQITIPDADASQIKTVGDASAYIKAHTGKD